MGHTLPYTQLINHVIQLCGSDTEFQLVYVRDLMIFDIYVFYENRSLWYHYTQNCEAIWYQVNIKKIRYLNPNQCILNVFKRKGGFDFTRLFEGKQFLQGFPVFKLSLYCCDPILSIRLIYLYFSPSSHLIYLCFCPV